METVKGEKRIKNINYLDNYLVFNAFIENIIFVNSVVSRIENYFFKYISKFH